MHHHWTFLVHFRPYLVYIKPLWVKFFLPIPLSVSTSSHPECQNTTICVVSYPANRWSFSVILTPLHWSPIFPTSKEQRNKVKLCSTICASLIVTSQSIRLKFSVGGRSADLSEEHVDKGERGGPTPLMHLVWSGKKRKESSWRPLITDDNSLEPSLWQMTGCKGW